MKNLWRSLVLLLLPGMVFTGCSAVALFRLADSDHEMLLIISASAVWWGFFACIGSYIALKLRNPSRFYYPAVLIMAGAFVCISGACAKLLPANWMHGIAGVAISALAWAFITQGLTGSVFKTKDRICFILGSVSAVVFFIFALIYSCLTWLETFFHYLAIFLILCWCIASPVTAYGKCYIRAIVRCVLLGIAIGGFFLAPVFSYSPWNGTPLQHPGSSCKQTLITAYGSRFVWIDKNDCYGIFTPGGRLVAWGNPDEDMVVALPAVLGCVKEKNFNVRFVGSFNSAVPKALRSLKTVNVYDDLVWYGESLTSFRPLKTTGESGSDECQMMIVAAWPGNQYPDAIQYNWDVISKDLSDQAVVAVRDHLLHNPVLFRLLHERYPYSGALPGSCRIWVFSKVSLDLSMPVVEDNLFRNYGVSPGTFAMLYKNTDQPVDAVAVPVSDIMKYGSSRWNGQWMWLLAGVAGVLLWRLVRLFGERRNIMYSFWNSMENGFAGMGIFLFCIGLLVQERSLPAAVVAIVSMSAVLMLCRGIFNSGWLAQTSALFILLPGLYGIWSYCLIIVAAAQMYFTGVAQTYCHLSVVEQRNLQCAMFTGMFLAALLIMTGWRYNAPQTVIGMIFLIARVSSDLAKRQ